MVRKGHAFLCIAGLAAMLVPPQAASGMAPTPWQVKKCEIYRSAWESLPKIMDTSGFTRQFRALNAQFIASGCLAHTRICPENQAEIHAANLLTIASMNGGTASSFLPFRC